MATGFQQTINRNVPLAVEGDFASAGPYHAVLAGNQQLKAGATGVTIARFAWANIANGQVSNVKPVDTTNQVLGFVRRGANTALITAYRAETSMLVPAGFGVTIYDRGDFWAKTTTAATVGQKVFASDTTGEIATDDAGATVAGFTETEFKVGSIGAIGNLIKITAF